MITGMFLFFPLGRPGLLLYIFKSVVASTSFPGAADPFCSTAETLPDNPPESFCISSWPSRPPVAGGRHRRRRHGVVFPPPPPSSPRGKEVDGAAKAPLFGVSVPLGPNAS